MNVGIADITWAQGALRHGTTRASPVATLANRRDQDQERRLAATNTICDRLQPAYAITLATCDVTGVVHVEHSTTPLATAVGEATAHVMLHDPQRRYLFL